MFRPTLIDINPVELKYYPFMVSLNKFTGSCIVLSPKICVPIVIRNGKIVRKHGPYLVEF